MIALVLACCLVGDTGNVYDSKGNRAGSVRENAPGQYDFYDKHYNRLGSGKTSPYNGAIDLYDTRGNRIGEIKPYGSGSRSTPRAR